MAVEPLRTIEPNRISYINQSPAAQTPELSIVPTTERSVPLDPEVVVETPEQIRQRELAEYRMLIAEPGVGTADAWEFVKELIREEYKENADALLEETDPLTGGQPKSGNVLAAYHSRRRAHFVRKARLLTTITEKKKLRDALNTERTKTYPRALRDMEKFYNPAYIEVKRPYLNFIDSLYASTPVELAIQARRKGR